MKILYICNYNIYNNNRRIVTQPSGVTKIEYIKSALKRAGHSVELLSLAEGALTSPFSFYKFLSYKVGNDEIIHFISTFCRTNSVLKILSRLWMYIQLLHFLIFKVNKYDCILVYHSLVYIFPIRIFRIFSGTKIYFEVEELFHAVYADGEKQIEKEKKYLRKSSGYILVNDLISKLSGFAHKNVVCYGVYSRVAMHKSTLGDDKIHIVYAGVIDNRDAIMAVDICRFLNDKYRMHIVGYGLESHIRNLQKKIEEINKKTGFLIVSYDGCLNGDEYIQFLNKCNIGICPRLLEDNLSNYTFPSKVLVYISNGILPVTSSLSCIRESQIRDKVVQSKENTAKSFAEAITSINVESLEYDNSFLDELDLQFVSNLRHLFSD